MPGPFKSSWLRPDDLKKFSNIGVSHFKIAGRDRSSQSLRITFDAYLAGSYDGGVFEYLLPGCDPVAKYGIRNLDNRILDSYCERILSADGCCGDCGRCNYCSNFIDLI